MSRGQITPEAAPYRQAHDEWVMLVAGAARLRLDDRDEITLRPGDHLLIPAGCRHWVTFTEREPATVWLAVHVGEER